MTLRITPCTIKRAKAFVSQHHRHHKPPQGALFAVGCTSDGETLCGVAIVGRPVARHYDDGERCEVIRLATDGTPNACSILYGACARAAKALGWSEIITYILQSEPGTSLKASGWICDGAAGGGEWNCKARPRQMNLYPTERKQRWRKTLRIEEMQR